MVKLSIHNVAYNKVFILNLFIYTRSNATTTDTIPSHDVKKVTERDISGHKVTRFLL